MKPVCLSILPALLSVVATPVLAQPADAVTAPSEIAPAPPAAVQPAPQNVPWSDVSHINGQIVPVGTQNDYLYKLKRTNISTNPVGWLVGIYGISVEYAMTNNIAIRADGNLFNLDHGNTTGYEVGLSVPIYLRRTFSGPFLELGILARGITSNDSGYCDAGGGCQSNSSTNTTVGPEVLFGWHWTFDSGLNVALAVGASRDMYNQDSNDAVLPAGYFRIGYAF